MKKNVKLRIKKCQIASKNTKQVETGHWLSVFNYLDEQWQKYDVCFYGIKPRFIADKQTRIC